MAISGFTRPFVASLIPLYAYVSLLQITSYWFHRVQHVVPEPYMDEIFHIGQARQYIAGNWTTWDPKITTPPGLYVVSAVIAWRDSNDAVPTLRALGTILCPVLAALIYLIPATNVPRLAQTELNLSNIATSVFTTTSLRRLHTAFNVALFPPLFFFSALYYTDVASTVSVMAFRLCFAHYRRPGASVSVFGHALIVLLGLISLTFRQTNVFWVGAFPAGLTMIDVLRATDINTRDGLHDPFVQNACAKDYFTLCISLVNSIWRKAVSRPGLLFASLLPYVIILASFAGFVAWNGGVVLGDKSNHIATLHLAQMLYLWPYIAFFSLPLLYPYVIQALVGLGACVPGLGFLRSRLAWKRINLAAQAASYMVASMVALVIARYSTVVHPFTLADNRHYVFYVFRILVWHPAIRYILAPVYVLCAWSVIQALGLPLDYTGTAAANPDSKRRGISSKHPESRTRNAKVTQPLSSCEESDDAKDSARISFVLVWAVTCLLQLSTAPLVEPRYAIVPWIMWRIHIVRAGADSATTRQSTSKDTSLYRAVINRLHDHDHRLWLETLWFLAINAGTGYMFLYKGFTWPQEPGLTQRFIW